MKKPYTQNINKYHLFNVILIIVGTTALLMLGVTFGIYAKYFTGGISTDQSLWAQFGDYFGGILNPLLSFMTILILLYTLRLQKSEIEITSKELEENRNTINSQNLLLKKQSFESTFINIMDYFSRCYSWKIKDLDNNVHYFHALIITLIEGYKDVLKSKTFNDFFYKKINEYEQSILIHYIDEFFTIIKYFDENTKTFNRTDRIIYRNLLLSKLSDNELIFIFLYCQNDWELPFYKELCERHQIFVTIKTTIEKHYPDIVDKYKPEVFGSKVLYKELK